MRVSTGLIVVLVLLGLIPIAVWAITAYGYFLSENLTAAGSRRTVAAARILSEFLLALAPALVGGLLMVGGAALLRRRTRVGRLAASIGVAMVIASVAAGVALDVRNLDAATLLLALAYVLAHVAVLVWLWRRRQPAAL